MRFLEARDPGGTPARVVIQGAPYDGGVSYRGGAAAAPDAVREASDSIESYSPRLRRDLRDLDLADAGDLALAGLDAKEALDAIALATEAHARAGSRVVTLGGDHSISIGTSRGLGAVYPDLVHIVYDAHMDMRESYEGSEWSHACGTRHMSRAGRTFALGIRSGSREEFADADAMISWSHEVGITPEIRAAIEGNPVFVSVDLDVLDPSILPGTGNPEPGGATYREVLASLLSLAGANVVGIDFSEVSPPLDPSGLSPIVAAEMVRECLLGVLDALS